MDKNNNKNSKKYPKEVQMYLKELNRFPALNIKEEKELFKKIEKGDDNARQKIANHYSMLVVKIAEYYLPQAKKLTLLDLIQEGNMGLFKAIKLYDWTSDYKFSTLAILSIKNSILRALADPNRTIRIPVYMIEMISKYTKARKNLLQKLSREPLDEEIAAEMRLDVDRVQYIKKISDPTKREIPHDYLSNSLETLFFKNIKGELVLLENLDEEERKALRMSESKNYKENLKNLIKNNLVDAIDILEKVTNISKKEAEKEINMILKEKLDNDLDKNIISVASKEEIDNTRETYRNILRQEIKKNISVFSQKEQKILHMRFGLDDGIMHTLEEVGSEFNVTREKIRKIQNKLFVMIKKNPSLEKKLWSFQQ